MTPAVHVLSCGRSITSNLEKGNGPIRPARVVDLTRWAQDELRRDDPVDTWRTSFQDAVARHVEPLRRWQAPALLSAEVGGLVRYDQDRGPGADDQVVLLASDTNAGMLAALLNAVCAATLNPAKSPRPIRVHRRPELDANSDGEPLTDGDGPPVHVIRVPNLVPVTTGHFADALGEIATALLWAGGLRRRPGDTLELHIAGGYKATLPYLVVLGEYLKAAQPQVRVTCLHEADPEDPRQPEPVEIRLRRVSVADDLYALDQANRGDPPVNDRLLGFAYTRDSGRVRLNDLGKTLRTFLKQVTAACPG